MTVSSTVRHNLESETQVLMVMGTDCITLYIVDVNLPDFLKHHLYLRNRLLDQGYKKIRFIRSLKKFIFRYKDFVEKYSVSAETIINEGFS
jgi:hypothetical protein